MSGCIVGWAHSKFGKHEGRDIESLIVEVAQAALADAGGSLESFYFALGPDDVYILCDLPDNVAAAATAMIPATPSTSSHLSGGARKVATSPMTNGATATMPIAPEATHCRQIVQAESSRL